MRSTFALLFGISLVSLCATARGDGLVIMSDGTTARVDGTWLRMQNGTTGHINGSTVWMPNGTFGRLNGNQVWLPAQPYVQPGYGYAQPGYAQPTYFYPQQTYQAVYAQPAYAQPAYAQPAYAQPAYAQPAVQPADRAAFQQTLPPVVQVQERAPLVAPPPPLIAPPHLTRAATGAHGKSGRGGQLLNPYP